MMKAAAGVMCSILVACCWCWAEIPVTGRVINRDSAPIVDAEVSVAPIPSPVESAQLEMAGSPLPPAAQAKTRPDGSFVVNVPDAGLWRLSIHAPGFVPVDTILTPLLEETDLGEIQLDSDAKIQIRVLADNGKPVLNAVVRIQDQEQEDYSMNRIWKRTVRTGRTNDQGVIELPRARNEMLLLSIQAEGFAFQERRGVRAGTLTVQMKTGAPITLRIVDPAGRPVRGALVSLGESLCPSGFSNDVGRIDVVADITKLAVDAPDGRRIMGALSSPLPKGQTDQVIRLPERAEFVGRIIDMETGQPLENAFFWSADRRWNQVATDRSGAYRLSLVPGDRNWRCAAAGYVLKRMYDTSHATVGETSLTVALQPAALVEGTVFDPKNRFVPGAELQLESGMRALGGLVMYMPFQVRTLRARPDGTFRIADLDPKMTYRITARRPGLAPAELQIDFPPSVRSRRGVRLQLTEGTSVRALIVDVSDHPVEGATMEMRPSASGDADPFTSMTDSPIVFRGASGTDGSITLSGVPAGKLDLLVTAPCCGAYRVRGAVISASDRSKDLGKIVLPPGATLSGRVLDARKQPVEGAKIRVTEANPSRFVLMVDPSKDPDAVSGTGGVFTIGSRTAGEHVDLSATREGYQDLEIPGVEVTAEPLILTMKAASRIAGKVLSSEGKAVPGASVMLLRIVSSSGGGGASRMTSAAYDDTTAEGSFDFKDISPDTYSLAVKAAGFQDFLRHGIQVPEGKDVEGLSLDLLPEALLEGTITSPDGMPVIGATIEMVSDADPMARRYRSSTTSDGAGMYQLHGMKPGALTIQISHELYPRLAKDIELRPGANHMDFQLAGGNSVAGRVVAETGAAVQGASVSVYFPPRQVRATTEADGTFLLRGMPDGDFPLNVAKEGMVPAADPTMVHVAGAPVDGLLVVLRQGVVIYGSILGLPEDKLAQVGIEAYEQEGYDYRVTRSDSQGGYRIPNLRRGRWFVSAHLPGGSRQATAEVTLEEGASEMRVDLRFGEGLRLSGHVLHAGAPVAGASISVSGKEVNSYAEASTGADGSFALEGLEKGIYDLHVQDRQSLRYAQQVDVQNDGDIVVNIPEAAVSGRVLDAIDGTPISGASLALRNAGGASRFTGSASTSDDAGVFELRNVADGDWALTATKEGYATATRSFSVREGRNAENLEFQLQPTEGITLQLRLPEGGIPDRVTAAILDPAGNQILSGVYNTREGGRLRLASVPAGEWDFLLRSGGGITPIRVRVPQPAPVAVTLLPGGALRLSVPQLQAENRNAKAILTSSDGRPFRMMLGWSGITSTELDIDGGLALIDGIPPGVWKVHITSADGRTWDGEAQVASNTTSDVAIK